MEKPTRPVRNRRRSRRVWPPGDIHRPVKRLFTPEIKRMLKDWLVRRRENPYPSRDEKKALAFETGLTYTQICNWFANWRRKLKNSGREPSKKTWGHLIKNYNTNAKGNVEQFSICSSDSIWGDDEASSGRSESPDYLENYELQQQQEPKPDTFNNNTSNYYGGEYYIKDENGNQGYYISSDWYKSDEPYNNMPWHINQGQCIQGTSTVDENNSILNSELCKYQSQACVSNTKYKHQMMEKYLRDNSSNSPTTSSPELSKWLESTANFTPNKNNYIEWNSNRTKNEKRRSKPSECIFDNAIHLKEELDAAEALTNLACNYRQRLMNNAKLSA